MDINDSNIHEAIAAWTTDSVMAESVYGLIPSWDTSLVMSMSGLLCGLWTDGNCYCTRCIDVDMFNEDIAAWDTSSVTDMSYGTYNEDILLNRGTEVGFLLLAVVAVGLE